MLIYSVRPNVNDVNGYGSVMSGGKSGGEKGVKKFPIGQRIL